MVLAVALSALASYQLRGPARPVWPASSRHRPPRLDEAELGSRANSNLDAALSSLQEEVGESKPYLTLEERNRMLEDVREQRRSLSGPPPPPPLPTPNEKPLPGIMLNREALEVRESAPLPPPPPPSPWSSGAVPSAVPYDRMLPLKPGAGGVQRPVADPALRPPAAPYRGVTLLQFDGLERANMLLLFGLFAVGFGHSSPSVLEDGTLAGLRLASAALAAGHVLIAGYGAALAVGVVGDGDATEPASKAAPQPAVLWFVRLLLTGAGGLSKLRRVLRENA